jgi:Protein of unknown function (DUF3618)
MTGDDDKQRALQDIRSDIESTRARLAETLDAIEERLDVRKRAVEVWEESRDRALGLVSQGRDRGLSLVSQGRDRFDALRREDPALVYGVLGGAAVVLLGAGVLVARGARR